MNKHQGEIVEYIVRKNGFNMSELAKALNVNRRSLYNWFNQKYLRTDIIFRIGCVIRHDFHKEFPEHFTSEEFASIYEPRHNINSYLSYSKHIADDDNWKNKYMRLLELFNNELIKKTGSTCVSHND